MNVSSDSAQMAAWRELWRKLLSPDSDEGEDVVEKAEEDANVTT